MSDLCYLRKPRLSVMYKLATAGKIFVLILPRKPYSGAIRNTLLPPELWDFGLRLWFRVLLRVVAPSISCSFWENLANFYVGTPNPVRVGSPSCGESWIRPCKCQCVPEAPSQTVSKFSYVHTTVSSTIAQCVYPLHTHPGKYTLHSKTTLR